MDFELDDQQRALRDEARRFLEAEAPITYARAVLEGDAPYDPDVHRKMAGLGWYALPFPEEHEGLGMGFIPLALLLAEMGRVVLPGPFFATVALGGMVIAVAGSDEQRARWLPAIASGEATAALAVGGVEIADGLARGVSRHVIDGTTADAVVVRGTDGTLAIVEPTARERTETIDRTRRGATLTFDSARAEVLPGDATSLDARIAVAFSAEILGLAERTLELSVDYAGAREQFGVPIGSFQAVKHRAADMKVDVESLRNAVYLAAWAIDRDHPDAGLWASMAKATASDIAKRVTRSGIQIHGGVGFTWEHDMHLFHKRALFDAAAFGDAAEHRERVATLLAARAR